MGLDGNWLYFETPDCNLVSLNLKDGKERWHTPICDLDQFYFGSGAPLVIKNHVITGMSGDDLDIPGYLESHDPETGALQWRWYTHPNKEDAEAKTWPNIDAMMHGGGMTWGPSTYDPELNLLYLGTGNPQPVIAGKARRETICTPRASSRSIPTPGKLKWYFQPSPHDTHDWDAIEVPMLIDGTIGGQPRKLLAQASRNGYFFVARPDQRQEPGDDEVRQCELGERNRRQRSAHSRSGEDASARWRAGLAEPGRRRQLAAAQLQPADRPVLHQRERRVEHLLHLRR